MNTNELVNTNAPVRVSLPVSVAQELGTFKKAVSGVLEQLGCPACCSGHDIRFDLQRDFVFDRALKVSARAKGIRQSLEPSAAPAVSATIAPQQANDIEQVFSAIDTIAEMLGCPACCSGHDLRLDLERSFVIDAKLNINENGFAFG